VLFRDTGLNKEALWDTVAKVFAVGGRELPAKSPHLGTPPSAFGSRSPQGSDLNNARSSTVAPATDAILGSRPRPDKRPMSTPEDRRTSRLSSPMTCSLAEHEM